VADQLLSTVLWQRGDLPALEVCRLRQGNAGYDFEGSVIAYLEKEPLEVSYIVSCSDDWVTTETRVVLRNGDQLHTLELRRDGDGHWVANDQPLDQVDGLSDVDLGISPCTNTLAIRRLDLAVGEARDVTAAWVRFPDLQVIPLPQRYTRLADRRYRYSSRGGAFTADLETDHLGLVINYGTWWQRIPHDLAGTAKRQ
jgi:hypothetical protein